MFGRMPFHSSFVVRFLYRQPRLFLRHDNRPTCSNGLRFHALLPFPSRRNATGLRSALKHIHQAWLECQGCATSLGNQPTNNNRNRQGVAFHSSFVARFSRVTEQAHEARPALCRQSLGTEDILPQSIRWLIPDNAFYSGRFLT
jgi:hypothetical protein